MDKEYTICWKVMDFMFHVSWTWYPELFLLWFMACYFVCAGYFFFPNFIRWNSAVLSSRTFTCFQLLNQAILSSNQSIFLLDPKVQYLVRSSSGSTGLVTFPWLFKKNNYRRESVWKYTVYVRQSYSAIWDRRNPLIDYWRGLEASLIL